MKKVTLVEVGARDGLQNEKDLLTPEVISQFVLKLIESGAYRIEAGAFVSPKWVPQMAGTEGILKILSKNKKFGSSAYSVLVPNETGFLKAVDHQVPEIALFASSTESFSQKNINCSIDESFARFVPIVQQAKKKKIKIRGYLSVCFGCPFEGQVPEKRVLDLLERFFNLGVYEISVGDTIGVAHVGQIQSLFKKISRRFPMKKIAGHFHDTRGQALVNTLAAYELGVRVFDTSLGGLGGCPYAPGAKGNVATEDVVYMFEGMGVSTGLNMASLLETHRWMSQQLGRSLPSRVGHVGLLKPLGAFTKSSR